MAVAAVAQVLSTDEEGSMTTETLDAVVERLISFGEKDPAVIASQIVTASDREWLADQLVARSENFISDIARRRLGSIRRSAEVALKEGGTRAASDLKVAKAWVPNVGWKRASDLTIDDLRARAEWYEQFADASLRRADWCRRVASIMEEQGVEILGDVKGDLPGLSEDGVAPRELSR